MSRANQNVNLEEVGSFFTTKEEREMNGRVLFLATAKLVVLLLGLTWHVVQTYSKRSAQKVTAMSASSPNNSPCALFASRERIGLGKHSFCALGDNLG